MSQGLAAAGSVLPGSVAAPGNQPQPQVVDWRARGGRQGCGDRAPGARGGGCWGSGVPAAERGSRGTRGVPGCARGTRGVRAGDQAAPGEDEEARPAAADAWLGGAVRSPSHVWRALRGLPRRPLPAAASTPPLARTTLPRTWEWGPGRGEGTFSPEWQLLRAEALPTSTPLRLPAEWGTRTDRPGGARGGPAVGGRHTTRWWKPLSRIQCSVLAPRPQHLQLRAQDT